MTPDLSLVTGFARGVLLSLHVRDTCLHSGSWLLSGFSIFHNVFTLFQTLFTCFTLSLRFNLQVRDSSGFFLELV